MARPKTEPKYELDPQSLALRDNKKGARLLQQTCISDSDFHQTTSIG